MDKINKNRITMKIGVSTISNLFFNALSTNRMDIPTGHNQWSREPSREGENILSKAKTPKINRRLIPRGKKGASVIIGYILLVTFGLVMSGIAFNYLKTYVPTETINCPDDASLFIKEYSYSCSTDILNITIKNNGKFNLDGFIIHSAPDDSDEIATDDLNTNFINDSTKNAVSTNTDIEYIKFNSDNSNYFKPTESYSFWFNLSKFSPTIISKFIEITPTLTKETNGKTELALCSNAQIRQKVTCS